MIAKRKHELTENEQRPLKLIASSIWWVQMGRVGRTLGSMSQEFMEASANLFLVSKMMSAVSRVIHFHKHPNPVTNEST